MYIEYCSETTLTGESWFHISTPLGIEPGSLMTGSKWVTHWTSETVYECSEIEGSPQGSPEQPTMSVGKTEGGPAACVKLRQKNCVRLSGINTLSARGPSDCLGRSPPQTRPNDQSHRDHQCSETTLTGESRFHISTPLGIETGSLMTGSKRVTHWTSETVYECSEIAGSPQYVYIDDGECGTLDSVPVEKYGA